MEDDTLRCSVSDLVVTFRQALVALVPFADRLKMVWRDEGQHRDWERLAEAVFDSCVRGPTEADAGRWDDELTLPRYDIDTESYRASSWIQVTRAGEPAVGALVRLLSGREPFDTVQAATLSADGVATGRVALPFDECEFVLARRSGSGRVAFVREIEAIE